MFSNKRLGFISFQQKTTSRQRTKRRWRRRRRLSLLFLTVEVAADENKNQLIGHDKEKLRSWSWQKANKDPISSNLFLRRVELKNTEETHLWGVRRIGCLIEWRGSGEARLKLEIEEKKNSNEKSACRRFSSLRHQMHSWRFLYVAPLAVDSSEKVAL